MKKIKLPMLVLSAMLVGAAFYTGCSAPSDSISESLTAAPATAESKASEAAPVSKPKRSFTPELEAFMEQINETHQSVEKVEGDYSKYVESDPKDNFYIGQYRVGYDEGTEFLREAVFSMEQVQADVDLLMRALQSNYGAYYYFGGDEKFLQVKEDIIKECGEAEELTGDFLLNCLLNHFSFLEDAHFSIEERSVSDYQVPCFYKETAFEKSAQGYCPLDENGNGDRTKIVTSVTGWENLDELFKRSIADDGSIVYYPAVYQLATWAEIRGKQTGRHIKPEDLTVHYADGSSEILTADPYEPYPVDRKGTPVSCHENQGVPVIASLTVENSEPKSDVRGKEFVAYAAQYREEPVLLVDLRANEGGHSQGASKWWETYAERAVTANFVQIFRGSLQDHLEVSRNPNGANYISSDTLLNIMGYKSVSPNFTAQYTLPDVFVDNDALLIILTSKYTASAAEHFLDIAHNVKNTLIIGENSAGWLFGTSTRKRVELPQTHLHLKFGNSYSIFPEDPGYFQEFRGFEPDLWVSAGDAEELAMKFIERYMQEE